MRRNPDRHSPGFLFGRTDSQETPLQRRPPKREDRVQPGPWRARLLGLLVFAAAVGLFFAARALWRSATYVSTSNASVEAEIITIASPAEAKVARLLVGPGDQVQAGQLLVRLDREMLAAALREAEADLASSQAARERLEADLQLARAEALSETKGIRADARSAQVSVALAETESARAAATEPERIRQARAQLDQAKAELELAEKGRPELIAQAQAQVAEAGAVAQTARKDVDRKSQLFDRGFISATELDAARSALTTADARLAAAQENLKRFQGGSQEKLVEAARHRVVAMEAALALALASHFDTDSSKQEVSRQKAGLEKALAELQRASRLPARVEMKQQELAAAKAQVDRARATLAAAEKALFEAEVRSPVSGVVVAKLVSAGERAGRGAALLLVLDRDKPCWVKALFPEHRVGSIVPGQPAFVSVRGYGGRTFRGRVKEVGSIVADLNPNSTAGAQRPTGSTPEVAVRIAFDDPELHLRAGGFANVSIRVR